MALKEKVPKEIAGLLVDEEFGTSVLLEAKKEGFNFAMPAVNTAKNSQIILNVLTLLFLKSWFATIPKATQLSITDSLSD